MFKIITASLFVNLMVYHLLNLAFGLPTLTVNIIAVALVPLTVVLGIKWDPNIKAMYETSKQKRKTKGR